MRALLTGASRARLRASGDFYEKKRKMIEKFWPILCRRSEPAMVSLHQIQHADLIGKGMQRKQLNDSLPSRSSRRSWKVDVSWKKKWRIWREYLKTSRSIAQIHQILIIQTFLSTL